LQRRDGRSVYFKSNAYNNETGTLFAQRSLFGLRFKDDKACSEFVSAHESAVVALKRVATGDSNSAPAPRPQRELQTLEEDAEAEAPSPAHAHGHGSNHAGPVAAPEGLSSSPKQPSSPAQPSSAPAAQGTADVYVHHILHPPLTRHALHANFFRRLQAILGDAYCSTGGQDTDALLSAQLPAVPPGSTLLDIGCGYGGSSFYLARTCSCAVQGVCGSQEELAVAKALLAQHNAAGRAKKVTFQHTPLAALSFPVHSFDAVQVRESASCVADLPAFLTSVRSWLKPGGALVLADVCVTKSGKASAPGLLKEHVTVGSLTRALDAAGFQVETKPKSQAFAGFLEADIAALDASDAVARAALGVHAVTELRSLWQSRLKGLQQGHLDWVVVTATAAEGAKPTPEEEAANAEAAQAAGASWVPLILGGAAVALLVGAGVMVARHSKDEQGRAVPLGTAAQHAWQAVTGSGAGAAAAGAPKSSQGSSQGSLRSAGRR